MSSTDKLRAVQIVNHSGFTVKSEKLIPPLRKGYYRLRGRSVGGDAPKDVIRVYEYGSARKHASRKWPTYIAKVGHKWYPGESITEHLLTRVGQCLGLRMAESRLMRVDNQIRFLSRNFLERDESLVHGAQIFSSYLQDDRFVKDVKDHKMDLDTFTFDFICEAVKSRFPKQAPNILNDYVRMLAFDAIVGNNDRHHYNWAVVTHVRGEKEPSFSPIYDSARALFWNRAESQLAILSADEKKKKRFLSKYVKGSTPLTGWLGSETRLNHFDLIKLIGQNYPRYCPILKELAQADVISEVEAALSEEFNTLLTECRRNMVIECLKLRMTEYNKTLKEVSRYAA